MARRILEEKIRFETPNIPDQRIVSLDLGLNNACTVSIMQSDGTIVGREFLSLPSETDSLTVVALKKETL